MKYYLKKHDNNNIDINNSNNNNKNSPKDMKPSILALDMLFCIGGLETGPQGKKVIFRGPI